MAYGWEGEKVRLVPLDRGRHLDNALSWLNDPEVTRWTDVGDWPLTRPDEEAFFDRAERECSSAVHFAIETLDGRHLGFSGLLRLDQLHGMAYSGSFIGCRELWGQGLGTDAGRVRARYAFEVLNLRMLVAEIMDGNHASLRMLEKVGYRRAGVIPGRYWKRGAYRDQLILVLERGAVDGARAGDGHGDGTGSAAAVGGRVS